MPSTNGGGPPDPKVTELIELWKRHASEIESDLLTRGINIADWHQDTRDEFGRPILSSRRLVVLLKHLPDESAFRTEFVRGGRQTRAERVAEETLNEALRLRASYETVASHGEVQWDASDYAWLDPIDQVEKDKQRAAEAEEREYAEEDFYADLGFS